MRRWLKRALKGFLILVLLCVLGAAGAFLYFHYTLPPMTHISDYTPPLMTRVFSADGEVIGEFYLERRLIVPNEKIPRLLRQAFVAAEDADFYRHKGISYLGILRAIVKNLEAGRIVQGGSTITQQVVRSLLLTRQRTLSRKIKELILAHRIERHLSKDEILYIYLNQIYLGHGNYGVGAAAEDYFGKSVEDLNLAEMALLAGLPRAPEFYSPLRNFERAKRRQAYVLKRMVEEGYITEEEAEEAYMTPLHIRRRDNRFLEVAPYFVEYVRQYLIDRYGEDAVYTGGLQVYTSLDTRMQKVAQEAVRKGLLALDRRQGFRGPEKILAPEEIVPFCEETAERLKDGLEEGKVYFGVVVGASEDRREVLVRIGDYEGYIPFDTLKWIDQGQPEKALKEGYVIRVKVKELTSRGPHLELVQEPEVEGALLAMELPTGYVRALVGGWDFLRSQYNRAIQARRQVGSAFKPIVYAAALEKGFTPATIVLDAPVIYEETEESEAWKPRNYRERFYGPTRLRMALARSQNVATVRVARRIGVPYIMRFARRLGITSPLNPDLSMALGSSALSLLELVRAYAVFATRGHLIEPIFITKVLDRDGHVLEEHRPLPLEADLRSSGSELQEGRYYPQVISEETAYLMTSMLQSVIKEGTGWRAKALGRPCAGKTGTTDDYTDAWFIGYTPQLITGVWVGFDEPRSLGEHETGSRAACPIWVDFMKEVLKDKPVEDFPVPEGIVFVRIDPKTGLLARPGEPGLFECFRSGTEPHRYSEESPSEVLFQGE
ncbi:MAG: penicillin-binding protein [Deltaproteobacteria bacterium]|nr:MAG: penicillin-binding protein [Deltaproteobacteria bacterium]